jgi:fatty acid-binding protein DegV
MAKTIAITADSPVDLGTQYASRFGISIIPLYIHLDGDTYRDGVDITPDDIFHKYETEKFLPTTSAIPVGTTRTFFARFQTKGRRWSICP